MLRVCKRNTRVLAIAAKNETAGTEYYRPIELGYLIYDSSAKGPTTNPARILSDGPNFPDATFVVPEDKPCYFTIKDELGIKARETPCSFSNDDPDEYSVIIRFRHEGWDDDDGAGVHAAWHFEC
jgi:hypothetical protein